MRPKIPKLFNCPKCEKEMSLPKDVTLKDDPHGVLIYKCRRGAYVSAKIRWYWPFKRPDIWVGCDHIACVFVELEIEDTDYMEEE